MTFEQIMCKMNHKDIPKTKESSLMWMYHLYHLSWKSTGMNGVINTTINVIPHHSKVWKDILCFKLCWYYLSILLLIKLISIYIKSAQSRKLPKCRHTNYSPKFSYSLCMPILASQDKVRGLNVFQGHVKQWSFRIFAYCYKRYLIRQDDVPYCRRYSGIFSLLSHP